MKQFIEARFAALTSSAIKTETKTRVLVIGCGEMAQALFQPWNDLTDHLFTVACRSRTPTQSRFRAVRTPEELAGERFDLCIVAVKPDQIETALPAYRPFLHDRSLVISMAAGVSTAKFGDVLPNKVIRIMPNLPVALGKGSTGVYCAHPLDTEERRDIDKLLEPTGTAFWLQSEDEIDRFTAVAGSGPGYAFELTRCWIDAAERLGFEPEVARELVLETMEGAIGLAKTRGVALEQLRNEVTSPAGTTQAGLQALNPDTQLDRLFQQSLSAAYERATELR